MANECSNSICENVAAGLRWLCANFYWIQSRQCIVQAAECGTVLEITAHTGGPTAEQSCALSEISARNLIWAGTLDALLPLQQECLVIREPCVSGKLSC